jgi:5-formyltetrahydrofolate cyclo-ligase
MGANNKKDLRKNARALRDAMTPDDRTKKSELILKTLVSTDEYRNAENVLVYVSTGSEVETFEFITLSLADGKNTFVPKVYGSEMKFIQIKSIDELAAGYYGILEPKQDEPVWDEIKCSGSNICIMPGLAFDKHFNRIGYGGGFYDKFLQKHLNIYRIAICFECQMVDAIEAEDTDVKPDMIITDREVMKNGQH